MLAMSPFAKEYIYSMNTPSSDKRRKILANAPGVFGQLMPITSVIFTAKCLSFNVA